MVHGPNGFFRSFQPSAAGLTVIAAAAGDALRLALTNNGRTTLAVTLADNAYGGGTRRIALSPGRQVVEPWDVASSHHWYDVSVSAGEAAWRFAGHVETGRPSISDPAATAPVLAG